MPRRYYALLAMTGTDEPRFDPPSAGKRTTFALGLVILVVAAVVRLPALTAALPYFSYVDEGHVMHHVAHLLSARTWEPDTYAYPSLPFYLVAAAGIAYSPVYAHEHGRSMLRDLSPTPWTTYGLFEPVELLLVGRVVTLAFSLGVVLLTGVLVARLAGVAAGLFAAWLAAWVPALVVRSSIVNINPQVALFVLAALICAEEARRGRSLWTWAAAAGACIGLATASKYPAALVALPVGLALVLARRPWRDRMKALLLAAATSVLAVAAVMPATWLRTRDVLSGMREIRQIYSAQGAGSYWQAAVVRSEFDVPLHAPELGLVFLVLALAGLAVALRDRRWAPAVWGWTLLGVATGALLAPFKFHAFRNLLLLVPLLCGLVALVYAWRRERTRRPGVVDALAFVVPLALFASPTAQYARVQLRTEDSRHLAVERLAASARPGDAVLVASDAAILPSELATIRAQVDVQPWTKALRSAATRRYRFLLLPDIAEAPLLSGMDPKRRRQLLPGYRVAAVYGSYAAPSMPNVFFGNGVRLLLFRRQGRAESGPPADTRGERPRSGRREVPAPAAGAPP